MLSKNSERLTRRGMEVCGKDPAICRQGDTEATRTRWGTGTNVSASQEEIKAPCPTSQQCEALT